MINAGLTAPVNAKDSTDATRKAVASSIENAKKLNLKASKKDEGVIDSVDGSNVTVRFGGSSKSVSFSPSSMAPKWELEQAMNIMSKAEEIDGTALSAVAAIVVAGNPADETTEPSSEEGAADSAEPGYARSTVNAVGRGISKAANALFPFSGYDNTYHST